METFDEIWAFLKIELLLTDEDLGMASAVIAYSHNHNGGTDVTCVNMLTRKQVTQTLPIDATQLMEWVHGGLCIQDAFPNLAPAQREFLMTGLLPEEWDAAMGPEE